MASSEVRLAPFPARRPVRPATGLKSKQTLRVARSGNHCRQRVGGLSDPRTAPGGGVGGDAARGAVPCAQCPGVPGGEDHQPDAGA